MFEAHEAEPGDLSDLEHTLAVHEEEIAAVIVEPLVQGAAGMIVHPQGYLRARSRSSCDRFGVLLIADEVAIGFGRTGTMFACEQEDVAPDLLCLAKGLTGGYLPLAATLTTERIYEAFLGAPEDQRTFFHGHTYTGNPLACAAALASLDAFEREQTLAHLQPKIRLFAELLAEIAEQPGVVEVRGRGMMAGIDLGEHDPAQRLGHRVTLEAREARGDHPPARRRRRPDAPAGDLQRRPAPSGRDHLGLDRGRTRAPEGDPGAAAGPSPRRLSPTSVCDGSGIA